MMKAIVECARCPAELEEETMTTCGACGRHLCLAHARAGCCGFRPARSHEEMLVQISKPEDSTEED